MVGERMGELMGERRMVSGMVVTRRPGNFVWMAEGLRVEEVAGRDVFADFRMREES